MSPDTAQALLADRESDRIERTISTNNTAKFSEAICAFANDLPNHREPGYLFIGADDETGMPSGLNVTDDLMKNLSALRSEGNILPIPAMTVERVVLPCGNQVAVVIVTPSDLPPVRYKGRIYIRVGPRKGIASEQEERMLSERRIAGSRSFDATPLPEASLKDLSRPLFAGYRESAIDPTIIEANHRSLEEQLASLRFFDLGTGRPTVAGMLLFGTNIRYFLPGAYVQFLRLPGTELAEDPIDQQQIDGDLLSIIKVIETKFRGTVDTRLHQDDGFKERETPEYPERALRELILNAIMHRDYQSHAPIKWYWFSDRMEIHSPGGLYGVVTPTTMETSSDYRNPVIAEALHELGYVNRYGYGIQRAQKALTDNGNPRARFEITDRTVLVSMEGLK